MSVELFESYYEHHDELLSILKSTINWAAVPSLLSNVEDRKMMELILKKFDFLSMVYVLDNNGVQKGNTYYKKGNKILKKDDNNVERNHRAYYTETVESKTENLTEPYFSTFTGEICVTVSVPIFDGNNVFLGMIVADCDIYQSLTILDNDKPRRKFEPLFKTAYTVITLGLFCISLCLGVDSFYSLYHLIAENNFIKNYSNISLDSFFQSTVLLTLSLAIFDLGKTIFEEEVLIYKDIKKNSTMRRTLTRFFSTILIAVSIEGLLLVFKYSELDPHKIIYATILLFVAALMLASIGIFVYFNTKAEFIISKSKKFKKK